AVMLALAGSQQTAQYGWYKVILYPEVYLGVAGFGWYALRRASVAAYALVLGLGGATATNWLLAGSGAGWSPNPLLLIAILVVLLGPAVFAAWSPVWRRWSQYVFCAGGAAMLLANLGESWILGDIFTRL
ncbi:MAG: hypothetical protein ACREQM_07475, partial [Candidatus Dormibacteraceae bacterium]